MDWRRELIEEIVARLDLAVANLRNKPTFSRENAGLSILDFTLSSQSVEGKIFGWGFLNK